MKINNYFGFILISLVFFTILCSSLVFAEERTSTFLIKEIRHVSAEPLEMDEIEFYEGEGWASRLLDGVMRLITRTRTDLMGESNDVYNVDTIITSDYVVAVFPSPQLMAEYEEWEAKYGGTEKYDPDTLTRFIKVFDFTYYTKSVESLLNAGYITNQDYGTYLWGDINDLWDSSSDYVFVAPFAVKSINIDCYADDIIDWHMNYDLPTMYTNMGHGRCDAISSFYANETTQVGNTYYCNTASYNTRFIVELMTNPFYFLTDLPGVDNDGDLEFMSMNNPIHNPLIEICPDYGTFEWELTPEVMEKVTHGKWGEQYPAPIGWGIEGGHCILTSDFVTSYQLIFQNITNDVVFYENETKVDDEGEEVNSSIDSSSFYTTESAFQDEIQAQLSFAKQLARADEEKEVFEQQYLIDKINGIAEIFLSLFLMIGYIFEFMIMVKLFGKIIPGIFKKLKARVREPLEPYKQVD